MPGKKTNPPAGQASGGADDISQFTLSADEAGKQLGLDAKTIIRAARRKKIPHETVGVGVRPRFRFRKDDIEAFGRAYRQFSPLEPAADEPTAAESLDRRTNVAIEEVRRKSPKLFRGWTNVEWDELYSQHGTGGPLTADGALEQARQINAKRAVREQFEVVLESDYAEQLVETIARLYAKARGKL